MKRDLPTITAIILTKNEEEMIANCIETLKWCDHVLVVDENSQDKTASIAENAGAKVISFASNDFSKKREMGLKRVKTDWVIFIDADERVTPRLYEEIAVHMETNDAQALRFRRENYCYGHDFKHGGWQNDYVTRVFERDALQGWQGEIHESPVFEGKEITLHTPLIHLTHRSTKDNLEKSAQWTAIEAQLLYESGVSSVSFFTLIRKGMMEFLRRGFLQGGYKDGLAGLIEALVQGMNRIMVYIQVWELQQKPPLVQRYEKKEQEIATMWKHVS